MSQSGVADSLAPHTNGPPDYRADLRHHRCALQ